MISNIKVNGKELKNIKHEEHSIWTSKAYDYTREFKEIGVRNIYYLYGHDLFDELPQIVKVNDKRCYKSSIDEFGNFTLIEF